MIIDDDNPITRFRFRLDYKENLYDAFAQEWIHYLFKFLILLVAHFQCHVAMWSSLCHKIIVIYYYVMPDL